MTTSASLPSHPQPRPGIEEIKPYKGGDASLEGHEDTLALSSNECALGPSPLATQAITDGAKALHRYPDGGGHQLKLQISETFGHPKENLAIGSGSDELISLLVKSYAGEGDEVLFSEHGFLMYPLSAKACGATPVKAPESGYRANIQAMLGHVTDATKIVFIANPNNPTGSYLSAEELDQLHAGLPPHVLLVIDGAYAEYAEVMPGVVDYSAGAHLVPKHQNVVMLRTFSKIFGLASLRVGWAYAPRNIIDTIDRVRGPFNVSAAGQAAAVASLKDRAHFKACQKSNIDVLMAFQAALDRMDYDYVLSAGNFVLVEAPNGDAAAMDEHLRSEGIIGRRVDAYGLPNHLRISMGTQAQMHRVTDALAALKAG